MLIYSATNRINGKQYVGQTIKTLHERWVGHLWHAKQGSRWPLHCAIRNYDAQSFELQVLDTANSEAELNEKEVYWIKRLNSLAPNGYNIAVGGNKGPRLVGADHPYFGKPRSPEVCAKIAAGLKGHAVTNESRTKMGDAHRGKKHTAQAVENMRQAKHGFKVTWGDKISAGKMGCKRPDLVGKKRSSEVVAKIAASNLGKKRSPETAAKISLCKQKLYAEHPEVISRIQSSRRVTMAARGSFDQKCIDAMRQSNLGRKHGRERVEKSAAGRRGLKRTPEQKERMRTAANARWAREALAKWDSPTVN